MGWTVPTTQIKMGWTVPITQIKMGWIVLIAQKIMRGWAVGKNLIIIETGET